MLLLPSALGEFRNHAKQMPGTSCRDSGTCVFLDLDFDHLDTADDDTEFNRANHPANMFLVIHEGGLQNWRGHQFGLGVASGDSRKLASVIRFHHLECVKSQWCDCMTPAFIALKYDIATPSDFLEKTIWHVGKYDWWGEVR